MAYIGKTPVIGNFQKCDSISVVNGQAAYTLQVGGVNVSPQSENHMLVSLNGILQAPVDSFTVSGSTLTFASNLITGDVIDFVMILGNVLDLGVPSDNTVSTAKIVDGAITSAKLGSGVGGKLLQVVTATVESQQESTSASFVDITGLSVSITPSSTSSKIFVMCTTTGGGSDINAGSRYTLLRNGTNLATTDFAQIYGSNNISGVIALSILDSPSTTSSTTYKAQMRRTSASGSVYSGLNNSFAHITAFEIGT